MPRRWLWLAALLGVLLPERGEACTPDPCQEVVAFAGLELADEVAVPVDGVVVLQAYWFGSYSNQELVDGLQLVVERAGAPVAGTLEVTEIGGVLVWRPAEPLAAGETYQITGTFKNPAGVPRVCAAAVIEVNLEFVVADGPAEPVEKAALYVSERVDEVPRDDLEALVCCDGAMPYEQVVCGIGHGFAWSEGLCVAAQAERRLRVDIRNLRGVDEGAGQWVMTLIRDGQPNGVTLGTRFTRYVTEWTCFAIELRNLATGEVLVSDEQCAGETLEMSDAVVLESLAILRNACESEPYTCAVADGAWDPEVCMPWETDEEIPYPRPALAPIGCACATGGGESGLALLLPWLLLGRRRARRG